MRVRIASTLPHRRTAGTVGAIAVLTVTVAACSGDQSGLDLAQPVPNVVVSITDPLVEMAGAPLWTRPAKSFGGSEGGQVVAAGKWFVLQKEVAAESGSSSVTVVSVDGRSGRVLNEATFPGTGVWPAVAADADGPLVVINAQDAQGRSWIRGIDMSSGEVLWTNSAAVVGEAVSGELFRPVGPLSDMRTRPVDGVDIFGTAVAPHPSPQRCAVCRLDARTGQIVWTYPSGMAVTHVALGDDIVVVALADIPSGPAESNDPPWLAPTAAVILDASSGDELGEVALPLREDPLRNPVAGIDGDNAVLVSHLEEGYETVVVNTRGVVLWRKPVAELPVVDPVNHVVVIQHDDHSFSALDVGTGREIWRIPADRGKAGAMAMNASLFGYVLGVEGSNQVVLDGSSGATRLASSFYLPSIEAWNGRVFPIWDADGALTAMEGKGVPLGLLRNGGVLFAEPA